MTESSGWNFSSRPQMHWIAAAVPALMRARRALVVTGLVLCPAVGFADGIEGRVTVARARDHRDVVIYLAKIPGKTFTPPATVVTVDQRNLAFQPHVVPVLVGTRVAFPNSDEVRHNVFSPTRGDNFDLGSYPLGTSRSRTFDAPGVITLLCNVHAEMSAYVIVTETPYFAVSDKDGHFQIPDVPPGQYEVIAWHERAKSVRATVVVSAGKPASANFELGK